MSDLTVRCPECGTEFEPCEDKSEMCVPATSGDYYLIPKGRNNIKKENKTNMKNEEGELKMENSNSGTNGLDMEVLAQMVLETLNKSSQLAAGSIGAVNQEGQSSIFSNKNKWAKTSKYYGKELCGYIYNPYMVRRWIQAQFTKLMQDFNGNVDKGIRLRYGYMYTIQFTLQEIKKLALLERKDRIAFTERQHLFTLDICKLVFSDYYHDCISYIDEKIRENKAQVNIKGRGVFEKAISKEVVVDHKVAIEYTDSEGIAKLRNELTDFRERVIRAKTYDELGFIVSKFKLIQLKRNTMKSKAFVEGFKKSGAYYTLKNLIMFDNYGITTDNITGRQAIDLLRHEIEANTQAYIIYAVLKQSLKRGKINK